MAVTISNVGIAYPPEMRSRAFAANSTVWGVIALAGPAAAAFMLNLVSWRGIFVISLPLVAVAAAIGWNRMGTDKHDRHEMAVDRTGVVILALFVSVLLVGLSELTWWSALAVGIGAVLAAGYWFHSGRVASPVLARRHFASFPFGLLNLIPLAFFAGPVSIDSFIPIYVQGGLGKGTSVSAFAVAFLAIGWTTGSQIVSRALDRIGGGFCSRAAGPRCSDDLWNGNPDRTHLPFVLCSGHGHRVDNQRNALASAACRLAG